MYKKDLLKCAVGFKAYSSNLCLETYVMWEGSEKNNNPKDVKSNGKPHLCWIVSGREILSRTSICFTVLWKRKLIQEVTRGYQSKIPTVGMRFLFVYMRNLWLKNWNVACLTSVTYGESLYGIRPAGQECVIEVWSSAFKNGTRVNRHEHTLTRRLSGLRCSLRRKVNQLLKLSR